MIIPLRDLRPHKITIDKPQNKGGMEEFNSIPSAELPLRDTRGRFLRDLRISVTDRCNFRCTYCMPKSVFNRDYRFLPQNEILSFEEIYRLAKIFVNSGTEKIRLTGGEPLLRRHLENLITQLATLTTPSGKPVELTLTTNAALLPQKAAILKTAGLHRVTVSLDALDDAVFRQMNDVDFPVSDVLKGIASAQEAGFDTIKVNMVVRRGVNDHQIEPLAEYFRGTGHILRFIEFMDVGSSNGWRMDEVVPSRTVLERLSQKWSLIPLDPQYNGEVAERWSYTDGQGEVGFISSVTQAFCHNCTRARLSVDGSLYTCLFATQGFDFRSLLRQGASDNTIQTWLGQQWQQRSDHYSEIRHAQTPIDAIGDESHPLGADLKQNAARKIEMSYIGG